MKITKKKIQNCARNIKAFFESEHINSTEELSNNMGRYTIKENPETIIEISKRPSNLGTSALTVSYIVKNAGIPIEARINQELGYCQIILKCVENIEHYQRFAVDAFKNIIQNRVAFTSGFDFVYGEIRRLSELV